MEQMDKVRVMEDGKQCYICGKVEDIKVIVERRIEKESHLYKDILQRSEKYKSSAGDVRQESFLSLCQFCDRLVSEYEEVCREKQSLQSEIEFKLTTQHDDDDTYSGDDELGIDEREDTGDKQDKVVPEKGEISDVNKFMNSNVKIFEIDVKHEPVVGPRRKEVVITKFEHKTKPAAEPEPVNKVKVDIDVDSWNRVFAGDNLGVEWGDLAVNIVKTFAPHCSFKFELVTFLRKQESIEFQANGACQNCQGKVKILSVKENFQLEAAIFHESSCLSNEIKQDLNTTQTGQTLVFQCSNCKKTFLSEARLNIHLKSCSLGHLLTCHVCYKKFANKRNLNEHLAVIHNVNNGKAENKFTCPTCGKEFHKKFNYTSHMLKHSQVFSFSCKFPDCGKEFKRERSLVKHCQVVHGGVRERYLCGQCGQEFSSQVGFKSHLAKHTGQEYVRRNIKCNLCDKKFRSQADLKIHVIVHTKEKAFQCSWPECGQSFGQKASLKDHINVHEERFKCHGCDKCFGRERYLVMHLKTCVRAAQDTQIVRVDQKDDVKQAPATMQLVQTESGDLALMLVSEPLQS